MESMTLRAIRIEIDRVCSYAERPHLLLASSKELWTAANTDKTADRVYSNRRDLITMEAQYCLRANPDAVLHSLRKWMHLHVGPAELPAELYTTITDSITCAHGDMILQWCRWIQPLTPDPNLLDSMDVEHNLISAEALVFSAIRISAAYDTWDKAWSARTVYEMSEGLSAGHLLPFAFRTGNFITPDLTLRVCLAPLIGTYSVLLATNAVRALHQTKTLLPIDLQSGTVMRHFRPTLTKLVQTGHRFLPHCAALLEVWCLKSCMEPLGLRECRDGAALIEALSLLSDQALHHLATRFARDSERPKPVHRTWINHINVNQRVWRVFVENMASSMPGQGASINHGWRVMVDLAAHTQQYEVSEPVVRTLFILMRDGHATGWRTMWASSIPIIQQHWSTFSVAAAMSSIRATLRRTDNGLDFRYDGRELADEVLDGDCPFLRVGAVLKTMRNFPATNASPADSVVATIEHVPQPSVAALLAPRFPWHGFSRGDLERLLLLTIPLQASESSISSYVIQALCSTEDAIGILLDMKTRFPRLSGCVGRRILNSQVVLGPLLQKETAVSITPAQFGSLVSMSCPCGSGHGIRFEKTFLERKGSRQMPFVHAALQSMQKCGGGGCLSQYSGVLVRDMARQCRSSPSLQQYIEMFVQEGLVLKMDTIAT